MKFVSTTIVLSLLLPAMLYPAANIAAQGKAHFWSVQSVDTMKYSRDLAREKLKDPSFDAVIDQQIRNIAATGATHVAVGTPYDEEFLPMLARWVSAARKHNLNVWFRGNFAGWEGWFGYAKITRTEHILKTEDFILDNAFYFEDGDIFTACPECENGGPGDPRHNGDLAGHRQFLIAEYEIVRNDFKKIGKDARANFLSMNGDVARLVMDRDTTARLDGVVTIDHYVKTPEILIRDIRDLRATSGGQIVLGEYGYPIPDINGRADAKAQAEWLESLLSQLVKEEGIVGLNYWTGTGSSTELWSVQGAARPAVEVLTKYYTPPVVSGFVKDELDRPVAEADVSNVSVRTKSDEQGRFEIPLLEPEDKELQISAGGYLPQSVMVPTDTVAIEVALVRQEKGWWFRLFEFLRSFFLELFSR